MTIASMLYINVFKNLSILTLQLLERNKRKNHYSNEVHLVL